MFDRFGVALALATLDDGPGIPDGDHMKRHSPEPGPGSRAFDVGEPKAKRGTRSKQTEQRVDLSEAGDLILPVADMGVGRDVVTRFAFGVLVLAALVLAVLHFSD